MRKKILRAFKFLFLLVLLAASAAAFSPTDWKYRQSFDVNEIGSIKVALPVETLDRAQADLRDLRIVNAGGNELPYALIYPVRPAPRWFAPKSFNVTLRDDVTEVTLETGTEQPLDSIDLATATPTFLLPARIESSNDGRAWKPVAENIPFFRQGAARQTALPLSKISVPWLRIRLGGPKWPPLVITSAQLREAVEKPLAEETQVVRILRTEEFAGETVLTLDLATANLPLASLEFDASDAFFTRTVRVAVRELHGEEITERTLGGGTIYRITLADKPPSARLTVPVETSVPTRELVVHIENGDSPPLHIASVRLHRRPLYAVFVPGVPGRYMLCAGNPQAAAPRYDLAGLASEFSIVPPTQATFQPIEANADYHQADPFAGLVIEGAALDPAPWTWRKLINLSGDGPQQLELDLPVLAKAQDDLRDLRLLQNGRQIPYIVERTSLSRAFLLPIAPDSDAKRPSLSRWKLKLPQAGLPLTRLSVETSAPLFQRHVMLYEKAVDYRGEPFTQAFVSIDWIRKPALSNPPLTLALNSRPQNDALWLEMDNGDNPPIPLTRVQAYCPVIRILFKAPNNAPLALLYGNAKASAPRYDIGLMSAQLLSAEKYTARLGPEEGVGDTAGRTLFQGLRGGAVFWSALAIVVILLLAVVAKLLPKPAVAPPPAEK